MTRIILCRHGERIDFVDSEWHSKQQYQEHDQLDPPLSGVGHLQVKDLATHIESLSLHRPLLISSPLTRAIQTAAAIGSRLGLGVHLEYGFIEDMFLCQVHQMPQPMPLPRIRELLLHVEIHSNSFLQPHQISLIETEQTLASRLQHTLFHYLRAFPGRDLIVVSHATPIQCLAMSLFSLPYQHIPQPSLSSCCCLLATVLDSEQERESDQKSNESQDKLSTVNQEWKLVLETPFSNHFVRQKYSDCFDTCECSVRCDLYEVKASI
eukprot:TRINITY_DN7839_c0_g2_i3.p1 TRINITY_DN7839_c0_g2~~TRINITY_DN7839_c0_g2_i3.p1  ORF type:complete len:290 (+),score=27.88 TRINITY_DN7839_c0_g2_i3:74-871(+)